MRLTTKGRYAVTAMLDIALHGTQCAVSASDISKRQQISRSYLERLLGRLHQSRLVDSTHGPGGGYQLAKGLEFISVADIIRAVDETVDATQCHGRLDCQDGERCMTHDLWANLNVEIHRYLSSVTLAELIARHREHHVGSPGATDEARQWVPVSVTGHGADRASANTNTD